MNKNSKKEQNIRKQQLQELCIEYKRVAVELASKSLSGSSTAEQMDWMR